MVVGQKLIDDLEKRRGEIRTALPAAIQFEEKVRSRRAHRFSMYFLGWGAVLFGLVLYWIGWKSETAALLALGWIGYGIWKLKESDEEVESVLEVNAAWNELEGNRPSSPDLDKGAA